MIIGTEDAFTDQKEKVGGNFQVLQSQARYMPK